MSKSFREDLTGQRFGRLTVLEFVPTNNCRTYWKCICDCGSACIVLKESLNKGHTKSCGCLKQENPQNVKHGLRKTRLYNIWAMMKSRCYKPYNNRYKNYGGRGIIVCDEWKNDFMSFYNWSMQNGYTDELTIDRIDVDGNYEPSNCRWIDVKSQCRNKTNNVIVEYKGERMSIIEAAEMSGIGVDTLNSRYRRGDRGERLFRPVKK